MNWCLNECLNISLFSVNTINNRDLWKRNVRKSLRSLIDIGSVKWKTSQFWNIEKLEIASGLILSFLDISDWSFPISFRRKLRALFLALLFMYDYFSRSHSHFWVFIVGAPCLQFFCAKSATLNFHQKCKTNYTFVWTDKSFLYLPLSRLIVEAYASV